MSSVAAVLFVRNEIDDILWWMAYYTALGFDALIVYDDHSTDGTWELLESARSAIDLKLHRSETSENTFDLRRRDAYLKAIAEYGTAFDWIGFFDCDEYFYPVGTDSVGAFLERFPNADAVAINWCIYGSNEHAFIPDLPPIAAYTRHAEADFPDNAFVRSFIRPKAWGGTYIDAQRWDIAPDRYVDAAGKTVSWQGSRTQVQWNDAKILHFVCRSMEHYLRRATSDGEYDLPTSPWAYFNRNDALDNEPLRLLHATYAQATRIAAATLTELHWQLKAVTKSLDIHLLEKLQIARLGLTRQPSTSAYQAMRFAHMETLSGDILCCDRAVNIVRAVSATDMEMARYTPVLLSYRHTSDNSTAVALMADAIQSEKFVPFDNASVLMRWTPLRLQTLPQQEVEQVSVATDGAVLKISSPISKRFLRVVDAEGGSTVGFDGSSHASIFRLVPCAVDAAVSSALAPYAAFDVSGHDLTALLRTLDRLPAPHADALACAIAFLPAHAKHLLAKCFPGRIPSWLLSRH